jgi:hypothetical protein
MGVGRSREWLTGIRHSREWLTDIGRIPLWLQEEWGDEHNRGIQG